MSCYVSNYSSNGTSLLGCGRRWCCVRLRKIDVTGVAAADIEFLTEELVHGLETLVLCFEDEVIDYRKVAVR